MAAKGEDAAVSVAADALRPLAAPDTPTVAKQAFPKPAPDRTSCGKCLRAT